MEFEEHIKLTLGEQKIVVRCLGLDDAATVRVEAPSGTLELDRGAWRELHRVLGRVLAPLPAAPEATEQQGKPAKPKPARQGDPWEDEEEQQLKESWEAGETLQDLAETHERSVGAIRSRVLKLGLEEDADAVKRANDERRGR